MPDSSPVGQSDTSAERGMTPYDGQLYQAWLEGFSQGWEEGRDDNWPTKWILRRMYWSWRDGRRRGDS